MCKYCEDNEAILETTERITATDDGDVFDIQIGEDMLYVWCDCGRHQVKQIKYCPMCGERLNNKWI